MRRTGAVAALAIALAFPAAADARTHLARMTVTPYHTVQRCTGPIPPYGQQTTTVWVNHHQIPSLRATGWTDYYVGNATLVRVHANPGWGPVCARAVTMLPVAHIQLTVRVAHPVLVGILTPLDVGQGAHP